MKSFFQAFFGAFFAHVLVIGVGIVLLFAMAASMGPKPPVVPDKAVLVFDLNRALPDGAGEVDPAEALQKALQGGSLTQNTPLPSLIKALEMAASDPKVSGLFITGNLNSGGAAALLELKQALNVFKEKKPVISYNQVWGRGELYLCSGLGTMYINPFGNIEIKAPSANLMFFSNAFKKYGIDVQVTKVGKYKSAVEPFIQDKMSPENAEQVKGYLGEIWDGLKTEIAKGRSIASDDVQRLANTKLIMNVADSIDAKLVDKSAYYDEVLDELKKMAGKAEGVKEFPQIDIDTYAKVPGAPQKGRSRIAVIVAEGEIVDGDGGPSQIGGDSLARELRDLRFNKNVKAVVMRVNSPGGSASASDVILREVIALKNAGKPVVVSMGNVAASGGYWISSMADYIFAEPVTITGSIGVFGMLPNVKKFANDHGITFDSVDLGDMSLNLPYEPLKPKVLDRVQALVDYVYDTFLENVSKGRKLEKSKVQEIAQGRVWAGRKALDLGLVDALGGLQDAVKKAAELAKIEGDYRVDAPGAAQTTIERLMKMMSGGEKRKLTKAGTFDTAKNELEEALLCLRSLNDPNGVYALAPIGVTIK
ncbi:MAG: signal peptide peptidase SppA [Holophagales bacterium]|jgi:protease-4|nr:signal peptide peptidase SppA [Holophagales bacterium]